MSKKQYINVWDLFVRISHWSLVLFVLIAFLSGDEKSSIHLYSGYTVLGIITMRFIWGFTGGKYARFTNFIYPPSKAIQYIKETMRGSPEYYIGHNPAAGWMIIFLLLMLTFVCATGYLAYQPEGQEISVQNFSLTKYAHADSDDEGDEFENESEENEFWEDIHEGASFTLLALIFFHILGALVSSRLHNENLIKSMITGVKETT